MKKVVFVTNFLGNGGAARVMSIIANHFSNQNINVEIISFLESFKGKERYKVNNNIKFTYLKCKSNNEIIKKIERILQLRKLVKQSKPDAVIAFEYFVNMQTILATLGLKSKIIVSERADPNMAGHANGIRQLRNFLYRFVNVLVCQTPDAKAYFPKKIQKKTAIIPNPIMPNLPDRYEGERDKKIVNFCRIERTKNLNMLVDAFEMINKEYPEYTLVIYGDRLI